MVSSINGLEKYPKLRFPGFEEPWKATIFGEIVHEFSERTKEEDEDTLLSAAIEGMFLNTELFGHQRGASNTGYKKIKYGTMVLSTQNLHLGNANVNQRFEHGIVSPAYKTYDITGCSVDLIAQWIKSEAAKRFFYNATTVGASVCRRNVEWATLYEQSLYLPCIDEQEKVAKFLALISERINKQQQFVSALKKYKRGLLRTVFSEKGNHSLLHDAASHRIDEVCDVLSGKRIPKGETFSPRPTEYRYITVSDMGEKYVCLDTLQFITSHTEKQIARYKVRNGDIIISVAGTLGKLNIITPDLDRVNLTENCDRFTNFRGINPEYLYHVLSSDLIQSQIEASKTKNGQPKLALERIRNFVVPIPHQIRQEQFVGVMNSIDKYIAAQQAVFDWCCKVRSGLLQQLFI